MAPSTTSRARSSQGGVVPPSTKHRSIGAKESSGGLRPGQSLPLRPRATGRGREVIIIDSEDSDSGSEYIDSGDEPVRSSPRGSLLKPTGGTPTVSLPTPPTKKPGIHAIAKGSDTVRYGTLDTPSSLAPPSILDTYQLEKTNGIVPRRSRSSVNDIDARNHRLPATPSTLVPSSSLDDNRPFSPRPTDKTRQMVHEKAHSNMGTSREGLASTATANSASATRFSGTLPSDPAPVFPLAVKTRIYSNSQHGSLRNTSSGPQRLEAFGFKPATKPAARTTNTMKRDAAAISTTAPTPICKTKPKFMATPKMAIKRLMQEAEAPVQVHTIISPTVPQTPRQPISARRASNWSSPSIGTSGDPYMLSSDNDSDSDVDDNVKKNGQSHKPRSLKSFSNITDIHETASDVEAVLDQFPAWLTTPSPPDPRSAYRSVPSSSQPSTASRPSARPRSDGGGTRGSAYRENRRVRFGGGDGFSPSPVPPKRTAAPPEQAGSHTKRIEVLSKSSPRPGRIACPPGRMVKSDLDEHTKELFSSHNKDEHSIQYGKKMLPRKRNGAISRKEKRASRHRNVDRKAWQRRKKALKLQKLLKIKREP
ncbi:hypothetical protein GGR51DRAFT_505714 [Nemania sp. FL0031]|nr:hypothetical protein GGR51DRAFT_505714 [Nemania sp. FL0031]